MKSKRVNGTAPASMLTRADLSEQVFATECSAVNAAPVRMQQALATLGDLKAALATGQGESNAARQQIDAVTETISGLRQNVIRLEQEVARVSHFAYHDELTGLANRSLLLDRLSQAHRPGRHGSTSTWGCCCSIWTGSKASTTGSGTPSGTNF